MSWRTGAFLGAKGGHIKYSFGLHFVRFRSFIGLFSKVSKLLFSPVCTASSSQRCAEEGELRKQLNTLNHDTCKEESIHYSDSALLYLTARRFLVPTHPVFFPCLLGFLPQCKDMHIILTGNTKLAVGVNAICLCVGMSCIHSLRGWMHGWTDSDVTCGRKARYFVSFSFKSHLIFPL